MATRENFKISANGVHFDTRHKWNAANRAVESKIGEIAKAEATNYHLVESESEKIGFHHVAGFRTWKGDNGNVVVFEICKV
jgi:hypothetical protein